MQNLEIFLPLGIFAIIVTFYLWFTGKKYSQEENNQKKETNIKILNYSISAILCIYIFRMVSMFFTGMFSEFYMASIIGLIIALIPIIAILSVKKIKYGGN